MELNIVNNDSNDIAIKFGINQERTKELFAIIEQEYYKVLENKSSPLVQHYNVLSNACNNIEEYTLCMHSFLMNITKIGRPMPDAVKK